MTHRSTITALLSILFIWTGLVEGFPSVLPGDIDANGVINSADLAMLKNFLTCTLTSGEIPSVINADVNEDGLINSADCVALARLLPARSSGDLYAVDSIVGNLRYVAAGMFVQGSPAEESCHREGQFTHTLTQNLAVMETEVTRQMWMDLRVAQPTLPIDPTNPSYGYGMTNPVQKNTWYEAVLFANLLSAQQGLTRCYYTDSTKSSPISSTNYISNSIYCDFSADGYRLPSEGEWEYCCRAGTTGPFWIAEPNFTSANCGVCVPAQSPAPAALNSVAWWCATAINQTHPAGTKSANPWNLYDVHGNVYEWCWDWYGAYPTSATVDYHGASTGVDRVSRGGCFGSYALTLRSASRSPSGPGSMSYSTGFRLVRSLP